MHSQMIISIAHCDRQADELLQHWLAADGVAGEREATAVLHQELGHAPVEDERLEDTGEFPSNTDPANSKAMGIILYFDNWPPDRETTAPPVRKLRSAVRRTTPPRARERDRCDNRAAPCLSTTAPRSELRISTSRDLATRHRSPASRPNAHYSWQFHSAPPIFHSLRSMGSTRKKRDNVTEGESNRRVVPLVKV